jgi:hypothetical protein
MTLRTSRGLACALRWQIVEVGIKRGELTALVLNRIDIKKVLSFEDAR